MSAKAAEHMPRPVTGPDGDNPITDEQIRELAEDVEPGAARNFMIIAQTDLGAAIWTALFGVGAAGPAAIADARTRCAAAYNARRAVEGRPLMHHRRYASGRRTCDLDGQNPAANAPGHEDTHDPTSVDCPMCIADLRARNLLPEAHP